MDVDCDTTAAELVVRDDAAGLVRYEYLRSGFTDEERRAGRYRSAVPSCPGATPGVPDGRTSTDEGFETLGAGDSDIEVEVSRRRNGRDGSIQRIDFPSGSDRRVPIFGDNG